MKSSYITQEGINVFIVSGKIYLSYFINNSNLIELSFDSERELKDKLKTGSLSGLNLKDIYKYCF
jgi:hypothetical protein|tara:strand:+ start:564 stop:758 length:195 start_codon:yes stop_codon:yes gene_type:complete